MISDNSVESIFQDAKNNGGMQYLYTLLRVTGLNFNTPDPLLEFDDWTSRSLQSFSGEELKQYYERIYQEDEPIKLLGNLFNCAVGKEYQLDPFQDYPHTKSISVKAKELIGRAEQSNKNNFIELCKSIYPEQLGAEQDSQVLLNTMTGTHLSLGMFLNKYKEIKRRFKDDAKLHTQSRFEVLQFLVNDSVGLYGFTVYFSNGSTASFERQPDATRGHNYDLQDGIPLMVGNLNALCNEWRMKDKPLYEVGLPGRYNKPCEWKPLHYPVDASILNSRATSLSKDPRTQGALFYMMCTGHRGIEFVLRTSINLPNESLSYGPFNIWKCRPKEFQNVFVYDGWYVLNAAKPEDVEAGINGIALGANLLAFCYGASVDWRLKYDLSPMGGGYACPSATDLQFLTSVFETFPYQKKEATALIASIDWFNRGRTSKNVFTSFLCYYIAVELIANELVEEGQLFGVEYPSQTTEGKATERQACIKSKYESLYSIDPERFIREAYFDCITGSKKRTQFLLEAIFGKDHRFVELMLKKASDGYSLSDIRSELAHGRMATIIPEHSDIVKNRVGEIAMVSRELLTRLIFSLKPDQEIPSWTGLHQISLATADPRNTLIMTGPKSMIPNTDWTIKPEWCD